MLKYFLFILILFSVSNSYSQKKDITYKDFSITLESLRDIDSSLVFLEEIVENTKNDSVLLKASYMLGQAYKKHKNNYQLSKKYLRIAEVSAKKIHNNDMLANIYMHYGFNFYYNESDSTLFYYNKALDISKKNKNYTLISKLYSNKARLYSKEKDYKNAVWYYHKSIAIGKKAKRKLCTLYNNLGSCFEEVDKDSAIYYYKESLNIAKKDSSRRYELRAYVNLGNVYLNHPSSYKDAYTTLIKGEETAKKLKEYKYLYYIDFYLGKYFQKVGDLENAKVYYNLALASKFAKKESSQQIIVLKQTASFYEKLGDYKKAVSFQKQYHHLKDSLYSVKKKKAFNMIRTQYEVAEKDRKITLLTKEKIIEESKKKSVILVSIIILTLLLFFTYLLKNRIKMQKVLREKEHKTFLQEIETKKVLSLIEGQENERKRLSKELHDGLGGQLSGIKSMMQAITNNNFTEKKKIIDTHLASSIKNLRNISHDLSANFLQNKDFDILVQQLISDAFYDSDIKAEISIFPVQKINDLPIHHKLNIYRIIQESVQNILKHANATYVSISLLLDNEISILIQDNGVGFDTVNKSNGIGLQNIKDRLQSIGGTLYIDSQLQKGTTININIPNS